MAVMKIFVYGHRHTGTTILRKIIGSHSQITEWVDEVTIPPKIDNVVFKYPKLCTQLQDRCKKVNIIKNPYDVFGSLRMRFGTMSDKTYTEIIGNYEKYVLHFLETDNIKIQYEQLFDEVNLKRLFESLDLKYEGLKERKGQISSLHNVIPSKRPESQKDGNDHANWRMWQINQPYRNMTGESAKNLEDNARKIIQQSEIIKMLYD